MNKLKLSFCILLASAGMNQLAYGQANYRIDNYAGVSGVGDGGPAAQALLAIPQAVAVDAKGGYYIADTMHFRIRYVDASGNISTVLDRTIAAQSAATTRYRLNFITAMALDAQGRLHLADAYSCVIVRMDQNASLTIVAGVPDNCGFSGDGGPATAAVLQYPRGIAFAPSGALLISDTNNSRVRRVDPTSGVISTIAGTGATSFGGQNTPAATTPLVYPYGIAADSAGNIYVAENGYRRVRKIATDGTVSTLAGTGSAGTAGDGGQAAQATFNSPQGLALDAARNRLYVSDFGANRVRSVALGSGVITHVAGIALGTSVFSDSFNGDGGTADKAGIAEPLGLAVDAAGNLLFADSRNSRIRIVQASGGIRTVAGRWPVVKDGTAATSAELDNRGNNATGNSLTVDAAGVLYISDRNMLTVRRVDKSGNISTFAGLPIDQTPSNGSYGFSSGDGASAKLAKFGQVDAIAVDASNNLYIADGPSLRRVDSTGTIAKVATLPGGTTSMRIDSVNRLAYLAVGGNHALYQVDLGAGGVTSAKLIAGKPGAPGFSGDGAAAVSALLSSPNDIAVDSQGRVVIADYDNYRIRRIAADGRISTIAGSGTGSLGASLLTPVPALSAKIDPLALAADGSGNLFLAENRPVVRMLDNATGQIRAIAGTGVAGSSGDGGAASLATLDLVDSIAADASGAVYVLDFSDRVRVLRPLPAATGLQVNAGNNQSGTVGTALTTSLSVRVLSGTSPVPGSTVEFKVTSGTATLSPASAISDSNGVASTNVTFGTTAGPVVITASSGSLPAVTFNLTATAAANPNRPILNGAGSVATAGAFGGGTTIAPGSWIEIYGANLAASTREWGGADFTGIQAPTVLDGVRVTIGGKPAFVRYVSPGQLNVQAPDGIAAGDTLVVSTAQGASDPYPITVAARAPSVLAPAAFKVNGVQYAAALFSDGVFVGSPNLIPGAPFRPAKPGDTIVLYGVGFGATNPAQPAGRVVSGAANLADVVVQIGRVPASVTFAGLVSDAIGLYQLNVVIPAIPAGDAPLTIQVGGITSAQSLNLTVAAP